MEEGTFLTKFASSVTIVHRRDTLRASKIMQERARANPKISFIWNSDVVEIHDTEGKVSGVTLRNVKTNALTKHEIDGVFIGIGHQPNTKIFEGQNFARSRRLPHRDPARQMTEIPACSRPATCRTHLPPGGDGRRQRCMAALDAERYLEV